MFNTIKSYFSDTMVLKNMVTKALKSENEELKDELKIRQKLPIVNGNITIFNINRVAYRPFYDSKWEIAGTENGSDFSLSITRYDTETFSRLFEKICEISSVSEIRALNMRDRIYYD